MSVTITDVDNFDAKLLAALDSITLAATTDSCVERSASFGGKPTSTIKPHLASYCKHYLHPGTPSTQIICPPCKVGQHLSDLHSATNIWQKCHDGVEEDGKDVEYWNMCRSWHIVKVSLVRFVDVLETWAEREREWNEQNPGALDENGYSIYSATHALGVARQSTPFLKWLPLENKPLRSEGKVVRFEVDAEEVEERPKRRREALKMWLAQY